MKQVLIKQGKAVVEEVPAPQVEPGHVLVRTAYSCISAGTEMSGIRSSGIPLWKRAMDKPSRLKKLWTAVQQDGVRRAWVKIQDQLGVCHPTGYAAAGTVTEVGKGVSDLAVGDSVACAGAQCAFHAEWICVPRNLVVSIPNDLELDLASTVTLGAIALQGVRRAQPTLGETFVVIGLGILGQLTAQLLKANGCHVIGVDIDRTRILLAISLGMDHGIHPDDGEDVQQVAQLSEGIGADGVLITAATSSDAVVSKAFRMCRKKGRVVLVGDVGLCLNRNDFYEKELDFFISTSYGPGRYDRLYEEEGLDYPVGYCRWTENRNMLEYVRLVAKSKVRVRELIGSIFPIENAAAAYESLRSHEDRPLIVLLAYPVDQSVEPLRTVAVLSSIRKQVNGPRVRLALVGAGGFAKATHLPNIRSLREKIELRAVVSRTGHNAMGVARDYQAAYATTDYEKVLNDRHIDAVLIATRHNSHAAMALAALNAGKHVLLEKPLALTQSELTSICEFYDNNSKRETPLLLTGFNRRFSPCARRIKELISNRSNPMVINYRMNAGYLPPNHWVYGPEGGGRNLGEACHIYDLFTFVTEATVSKVIAQSLSPQTGYYSRNDNFITTIGFADGTVASLTYTALGSTAWPKESMEIYVDGTVLVLEDYLSLAVYGRKAGALKLATQDKGQLHELEAFVGAILKGRESPIPVWEQIQATQMALKVELENAVL